MRDQLVRYLMGELNAQEREQLEAALRDSPELQREFAHLKKCLPGPDECDSLQRGGENAEFDSFDEESFEDGQFDDEFAAEDVDRPAAAGACSGLVGRTLEKICGDGPCHERPHTAAEISAAYDAPAGTPSWSLADLTVAGGVFLAVSMLFVPALRQSRDASRRTDCVNNLHEVGRMLACYSEAHNQFLPTPAIHENAGIFALLLVEDGYAGDAELARLLVCRASPIADDIAAKRLQVKIPTLCEFQAATPQERCFWKRMMSPSYAYRIGYVEDGQYSAIRNEHSCRKAVLADNPRKCKREALASMQSDHHGGQNVLFEDGHVDFLGECTLPDAHFDKIYVNFADQEAAGLDRDDVVLGRSDLVPAVGLQLVP
jgi:hypothetical protein